MDLTGHPSNQHLAPAGLNTRVVNEDQQRTDWLYTVNSEDFNWIKNPVLVLNLYYLTSNLEIMA